MVGVVAVIAVVIMIAQAVSKPSKADVVKSFEAYKNYIEYGPDNSGGENNWFLFRLVGAEYTESDRKESAEKSSTLFTDFQKTSAESKMSIDADLQNLITNESALLNFATVLINLDSITQPLIESYLADGMEVAKGKIEQVVPQKSNSDFRNKLRDALIEYIKSNLDMYVFYNQNYCIDDGVISNDCVALLDADAQYTGLLAQDKKYSQNLQRYFSRLEAELKANTIAIQEKLNE